MRGLRVEIDGREVGFATEAAPTEGYPRAMRVRVGIPEMVCDARFRRVRVGVPEEARAAVVAGGERTMLATDGVFFG